MEGDREQSALLAQTDILDRTGIHIRLTVVDGAEEAPICHIPISEDGVAVTDRRELVELRQGDP